MSEDEVCIFYEIRKECVMTQEDRVEKVEAKIEQLIREFKQYPDKFLTEEDLRSYLYHLLLEDFETIESTEDNSQSISLHCEVRWYGESQKLKYRSDIVIFDVSQLITSKDIFDLPTKGYGFNNPFIIIEIKLRRINGVTDAQFKKDLKNDRKRLEKIRSEMPTQSTKLFTYLLGFDKKSDIHFAVINDDLKEYYITKIYL